MKLLACTLLLVASMSVPMPCFGSPMDGPLHIRNTGPLANLYGLPRVYGGDVVEQGVTYTLGVDYGNTFSSSRRGANEIVLDGETAVTFLTLRGAIGAGWEFGLEVPHVAHRKSDLDSFIDEFHDLFGLPDGGRGSVPRGRLEYRVDVDGQTHASVTDSQSGLGDVRLLLGRSLYRSAARSGAMRLQIKAPLGDVSDLTGSEAVDAALWWEHDERQLFGSSRLSGSAMLGLAYLGDGELVPRRQNRAVGLASLGLRWRLTNRLQLNLQADAHGAPVDTDLGELREDGVQGTIGGRILFTERLWLDLGVVENLESASSPDAVFLLHLSGRW